MVSRMLWVAVALLGAWWGMQAVHEAGHLAGAWLTGGSVTRVLLHPRTISRTDVSPNPHPLFVAWAGPVVGAVLPLMAAGVWHLADLRHKAAVSFFAGFCLIANGLYIGAGSFAAIGDAGDLLRHGAPQAALLAFGSVSSALGLWIWHCLTKRRPWLRRAAIPS